MLNLLPPTEKIFLAKEQQKKLFAVLSIELLFFLVCLLLVLLSLQFYFLSLVVEQGALLEGLQQEKQALGFSELKDTLENYNQKLVLIDSFAKENLPMADRLEFLLGVERPAGLYFNALLLETKGKEKTVEVSITGLSNTRENLIAFKNSLESFSNAKDVYFSPESWISQKDINFKATLKIADLTDGK